MEIDSFEEEFDHSLCLDHLPGITEFYNVCHSDKDGKFISDCPGSGQGANLSGQVDRAIQDTDGLSGKLTVPEKRGPRQGSLADPHEGTKEVDGVRGYDPKTNKPVPGTDAWLEAHGITREVFEQRPYVRFEADQTDPAIVEAYKDLELQKTASGKLVNKGLNFWQHPRIEESEGGYIMYKTEAPGAKEGSIAAQVRPNVGIITDPGDRGRKEGLVRSNKERLDTLKNMKPAQLLKEREQKLKEAKLNVEKINKATPESWKAEADKKLAKAEKGVTLAKKTGDAAEIKEAERQLTWEKAHHDRAMKDVKGWDKGKHEILVGNAERDVKTYEKSLASAKADPAQALANSILRQEGVVKRAENAYKKTQNKYIFPKGEKVARIDVGGDPQNVKNLEEGKGRLYFAMEGAIKHDAVQTAIKKEDPTAAVVNVPSVTLWQQNAKKGAASFDFEDDGDSAEVEKELTWFVKKYAKNREVVLIPDADGVTNPAVVQQAESMAGAIKSAGAKGGVYIAAPPLKRIGTRKGEDIEHFKLPSGAEEGRKGIDDHLGAGRGTLGQLTYETSSYEPKFDLSHLSRKNGGNISENGIKNTEKTLEAISRLVGPKGVSRVTAKTLENTAQLSHSSAKDARDRLEAAGIIRVENLYDRDAIGRGIKARSSTMTEEREIELIKKKVIKPVDWDNVEWKADNDQSSIISIVNDKYLEKDSHRSKGTLQELDSWKPPKSFKGWTSPVTGKRDSTGIAKSVQETSLINSKALQKRQTKKVTPRVRAIEIPGVRYVRSAEGAKRYGVPIGAPIPEGEGAFTASGVAVSMTMGDLEFLTEEPGLLQFYNKCNDPETGRFCEGNDGPGRIRDKKGGGGGSSKGGWPSKGGRKVTKVSDNTYEVETSNGAKIQLVDKAGNAGDVAERLLNNHARMHEMYPLSPPRNIVVEKPSLLGRGNLGKNDVSLVNALDPNTYINSRELEYDTKSFREGWAMHSSQTGNTKDMDYILSHEYGHHVDFERNSDGYTHRPNALFSDPAIYGTLSRYGRSTNPDGSHNAMEAYAETFADWHHTDGKTRNPATVAMARDQQWYGWDR